jgi:hypothetical protein
MEKLHMLGRRRGLKDREHVRSDQSRKQLFTSARALGPASRARMAWTSATNNNGSFDSGSGPFSRNTQLPSARFCSENSAHEWNGAQGAGFSALTYRKDASDAPFAEALSRKAGSEQERLPLPWLPTLLSPRVES